MRCFKLYTILFCAIIFIAASCKKQINSQVEQSRYELLTANKWQLSNLYYVEVATSAKTDFTSAQYNSCEMVDTFLFATDNNFHRIHVDSTCSIKWVSGPTEGASWLLDSMDAYLVISNENDIINPYKWGGKILQLDNTTLQFEAPFTDYFGNDAAYIFYYKAVK